MGYVRLHGFQIMAAGFLVVAACAVFYGAGLITHFMTHHLRNATYSCALCGLVIYAIGRTIMYVEQRNKKRDSERADTSNKEPS
jgi:membrane protein YqaA with SNARE-associated domain